MRGAVILGIALVVLSVSGMQAIGGGALGGGAIGQGAIGSGALGGGGARGVSAPALPANPQYHLAAWLDFANGATNGEQIGDTQNICPSGDSATSTCLGQASPTRRGNWATAANCVGSLDCWQWAALDHAEGQLASPASDWGWLGEGAFVFHLGMVLNATLTGFSEVFANHATTSSNVPGVLVFLDHRLGGRDIVVRIGGAVTQTDLDANDCMLGVDETSPFIITVKVTASSGAGSIEILVNGVSCDTGVMQGYSPTVTERFGIPSPVGGQVTSEGYFAWADTETNAGSVAAMTSRGDQALAYYAAQLGITLP